MRDVVLLQSMSGDAFSLVAGQLVGTTKEEAERLIAAGYARDLATDEPTKVQLQTRFSMVAESDAANDPVPSDETTPPAANQPATTTRRRR